MSQFFKKCLVVLTTLVILLSQVSLDSLSANSEKNVNDLILQSDKSSVNLLEIVKLTVTSNYQEDSQTTIELPDGVYLDSTLNESEQNIIEANYDPSNNKVTINWATNQKKEKSIYIHFKNENTYQFTAKSKRNEQIISSNTINIKVYEEKSVAEDTATSSGLAKSPSEKRSLTRAGGVYVSNYAQFRDAVRDISVEEINVISDIIDAPAGNEILVPGHPVTINGNNKTINLNSSWIRLQGVTNSTQYKFTINDAHLVNTGAWAFVQTYYNTINSEYWSLHFNNITTNSNMERLAAASRSNITFGGTNKVYTRAENVYTGGMTFLPNSTYEGINSYYDYSTIWFQDQTSSTGLTSHKFNVEEGATVKLKGTTNGTTYPAIFQYYDEINIAKDATLDVEKKGVTVAFHQDNSSLNIDNGATFRGTSLSTGTNIIGIDARRPTASNVSINAKEGSYFYVVGNSTAPLINLSTTGSKLILTNPAKYDIRNNNNLSSVNGYAVQVGTNARFEILNSDLEVWTKGTNLDGAAMYSWYNSSLITDTTGIPTSASEPSILSYYKGKTFSRIAATNANPIISMNEVTNADKKLNGNVTVDGSPAWAGQVDVKVSNNQDSQTWTVPTDANGTFNINLGKYYKEGTIFTATGLRGPHASEDPQETVVVQDVTPPTPTIIYEPVNILSRKITGVSDEPGAKVTATVNGAELILGETVIVGTDGKWELPLSTTLNNGDVVQVFLTDTNNNKNPNVDTIFRDATFYKATKTIVSNETPPTADPVNMILNVGETFPTNANAYLKNVFDSSGETIGNGLTASFVNGTIPSTSQVGRFTVDVRLTDSKSLSTIINVPVFIKDDYTSNSSEFALRATDFDVDLKDISQLNSIELNQLIIIKSKAEGWNITTGGVISNQITVLSTNVDNTNEGIYSAILKLEDITRTINIKVIERTLKFNKVPSNLCFQSSIISSNETIIFRDDSSWDMSVFDNRGMGGTWKITASIESPLTSTVNTSHKLQNALVYIDDNGSTTPLSTTPLKVFEYTTGTDSIIAINWEQDKGILVKINPAEVYAESYTTTINWTLYDAP